MILNFKDKKPASNASAKVVDGKLILSFPEAATPVVWTMDVAKAKASAMEVLQKGDDYTLSLKSAAGEQIEVATFSTRDAALEGLMLTSEALENAHGSIRNNGATAPQTVANDAPSKKAKKPRAPGETKRRLMGVAASLVFLVVMIMIWGFVMPTAYYTGERVSRANAPGASLGNTAAVTDPQNSSGVPVSADAFLSGQ